MREFNVRFTFLDAHAIDGRLIRNPNYGGPSLSLNGWTWRPEISKSKEAKPGFHASLKESIQTEGVRNPVIVYALPEGIFLTFGGSRAQACRELDKYVPAIINDYTGDFSACTLVTSSNWTDFFKDPPRSFTFGEHGADYHYHLERARRHEHDEAGLTWMPDDADWLDKEFPWINS